jgi:hypothetical protein
MVKVTLLCCLLSANCQPGCPPPIHLSSLPWLVVALPLVVPYPPSPVIFITRCLLLLFSCRATSTSHCLKVPPAFQMPLPLICWCLQLVVTTPLLVLLPLLVLSKNPPPLVFKCLPSHWPLVCQLVVTSPMLSRRRRLLSIQHVSLQ